MSKLADLQPEGVPGTLRVDVHNIASGQDAELGFHNFSAEFH